MARKTSLTILNKAVEALIRGGYKLRPGSLRELQMAFWAVKEDELKSLEQPREADLTAKDPLAEVRLELKRAKGSADRFIPYLMDSIAESSRGKLIFDKADSASIRAVVTKAQLLLSDAQIAEAGRSAFEAYRQDYDTSYRLKSV